MCALYQPCYYVVVLMALVLIAVGIVPIVYRNELDDNIGAGPLRDIFGPSVTPFLLWTTGLLLIIAGILLLLQSFVRFWVLHPKSGCCTSMAERANQEMMWMLYGKAYDTMPAKRASSDYLRPRRRQPNQPLMMYAERQQEEPPDDDGIDVNHKGMKRYSQLRTHPIPASLPEKQQEPQRQEQQPMQFYSPPPQPPQEPAADRGETTRTVRCLEDQPPAPQAPPPAQPCQPCPTVVREIATPAPPAPQSPPPMPMAMLASRDQCLDCTPDCTSCSKRPQQAASAQVRVSDCARCCNPMPAPICGIGLGQAAPPPLAPSCMPEPEPCSPPPPPPQQQNRPCPPQAQRPMAFYKPTFIPPSKVHRISTVPRRRMHQQKSFRAQPSQNVCVRCQQVRCVCRPMAPQ